MRDDGNSWCRQSATGDLRQLGADRHQCSAGWARCRVHTSAPSLRLRPRRLRFRRPSELPRRGVHSQPGLHRSRSQVGGPSQPGTSRQEQSRRRLHYTKPRASSGVTATPAHAQRWADEMSRRLSNLPRGAPLARQERCTAASAWCVLLADPKCSAAVSEAPEGTGAQLLCTLHNFRGRQSVKLFAAVGCCALCT